MPMIRTLGPSKRDLSTGPPIAPAAAGNRPSRLRFTTGQGSQPHTGFQY